MIVSDHALERVRQRIDPYATPELVAEAVRVASPAPAWVRKALERCQSYRPDRRPVVCGRAVFLLADDWNAVVVVTAIALWDFEKRQKRPKPPAQHTRVRGRKVTY